jgi:competence protein ComEA
MTLEKLNRLWLLATGILILIILISSLVIWQRRDKGIEILLSSRNSNQIRPENIIIDGAVINPGSYPLKKGDTIDDLIEAAGGQNNNADLSGLKIIVPQTGNTSSAQKIDINRADIWLLQALPGIGEIRAQAIVDFRKQNSAFKNIEEIMLVPGFNSSSFEKIKGLITVSE